MSTLKSCWRCVCSGCMFWGEAILLWALGVPGTPCTLPKHKGRGRGHDCRGRDGGAPPRAHTHTDTLHVPWGLWQVQRETTIPPKYPPLELVPGYPSHHLSDLGRFEDVQPVKCNEQFPWVSLTSCLVQLLQPGHSKPGGPRSVSQCRAPVR